jgi:intracellular septation protein
MKQLLELVPIALFFIIYNMKGDTITIAGWEHEVDGILTATAVLMVATVIQVIITYILTRELEKRLLWLMVAVLGFGGLTLVYRDGAFIQWKPTIFNWGMAIVFGASQFIGKKNLMERILGSQIHLPKHLWTRLNFLWIGNFTLVGALNLVVAFNYSEETWVSYKLYSAIGFTLLLTIITAIMIAPHVKEVEEDDPPLPQDE